MKWKSNDHQGNNRRLSQPDMDQMDSFHDWRSSWSAQNTPRGSIDNASIPEELIMATSSATSTAQKNNHLLLPPIHESDYNSKRAAYAAQYNRALHAPTRFLPQNQAVITTNGEGIILLFNDIASLCFGINKSFIGKSILTSLVEDPFRKQITSILNRRRNSSSHKEQSDKGPVLVCGTIVSVYFLLLQSGNFNSFFFKKKIPIKKLNGTKSIASLWLKEKKTDHKKHIYIWIFEEIYDTSLSVYVDSEVLHYIYT